MPFLLIPLFVILGLAVLLVLWGIGAYNRLVREREFVRNSMAQIAAQVESRWDAIKNMIEGTKQYSDYESKTLESITESRASLGRDASVADIEKDDALFAKAMNQLYAVAENYPDLKSNENFIQLQKTLATVEEQLSAARRFYNAAVTQYNNRIMTFPGNMMKSIFGFQQEAVLEIREEERENISIKELF